MRLRRSGLEKDLQRWHALGWVSDDGATAIAGELALRPFGLNFGAILSLLGAALLCFAAMTFVAANWSDMAKITRLAVLFGTLWASYGVAWPLFHRGLDAFAHGAVLVGSGVFGACIMLIAQTYHMDGHPPDAVLLWAIGALAAAVLMRSVPSLVLAIGLFALWAVWDIVILETPPEWPYLTATAICAAACLWLGTRVGFSRFAARPLRLVRSPHVPIRHDLRRCLVRLHAARDRAGQTSADHPPPRTISAGNARIRHVLRTHVDLPLASDGQELAHDFNVDGRRALCRDDRLPVRHGGGSGDRQACTGRTFPQSVS